MPSGYTIHGQGEDKQVKWHGYSKDRPNLQELVAVAERQFPSIPLDQLSISASGYDCEEIILVKTEHTI